jgi:hypothetical protein
MRITRCATQNMRGPKHGEHWPLFNNVCLPMRLKFDPSGELSPPSGEHSPLPSPSGGNTLLFRRTKGRTEGLHTKGITSPLRNKVHPCGSYFALMAENLIGLNLGQGRT